MRRLRHGAIASLTCLLAAAAVAACAAAAPYNPDHLAAAQIDAVDGICQSVLGLSPAEGSNGATLEPANPHLTAGTTHFQGCIASLSDSLRQAGASSTAAQADASCRARGLQSGSGELALCVLAAMQTPASDAAGALHPAGSQAQGAPQAAGPFFYASGRESVRREQLACAALGLEPPSEAFRGCVHGLESTFFAIDNPLE
jgi:hypothetical protein